VDLAWIDWDDFPRLKFVFGGAGELVRTSSETAMPPAWTEEARAELARLLDAAALRERPTARQSHSLRAPVWVCPAMTAAPMEPGELSTVCRTRNPLVYGFCTNCGAPRP